MDTLILKGRQAIEMGAELIKKGEVVAFPTETVYGLGGDALNIGSIKKIYEAKGRPSDNPLIVHIAEMNDIIPLVKEFGERNKKVADAFMPGPITLLFPKSDIIDDIVTAGLNTVGIRMPMNETAREFIKACGTPIAAPSANASTRVSPTTAEHVYEDMKGRIPLIIDGGESNIGIESTVLDLTGDIPTILRPGAITAEMLLNVIGEVRTHKGEVLKSAPSPGMKYKHYSPLVEMAVAKDMDSLIKEYDKQKDSGKNPIALIKADGIALMQGRRYINLGNTDDEVCRSIYKEMRHAEKISDYIICIHLGLKGVSESVMNRVMKAAGGKLI